MRPRAATRAAPSAGSTIGGLALLMAGSGARFPTRMDEPRPERQTSGESPTYFAEYKLKCLERLGAKEPVLDFGCGIGNLTEQLVKTYQRVHGYDPSSESLELAKPRAPSAIFQAD